jgi:hypothetical protein
MPNIVYPLAGALSTEQAALKLWTVRRLLREGAMDARAAETSFKVLRRHANPRIAAAAGATPEPVTVKEFAR